MHPHQDDSFHIGDRFFYGAVVGAIFGTLAGSISSTEPMLGLAGFATGAVVVGTLAAVSKNFWESLLAAWALVRVTFWH